MKGAANVVAAWVLLLAIPVSGSTAAVRPSDLSASIRLVIDGLDFPANLVSQDDRTLILEKDRGTILILENGRILDQPLLDIRSKLIAEPNSEEGLLGAALPSDFTADPSIYVTYVAADGNLRLSRFRLVEDGDRALPASEEIVFSTRPDYRQHYCGHIAFGPKDGLLYMCVGDGQTNRPPAKPYREVNPVAQDLSRPHGKIIRFTPGPAAVRPSLQGPQVLADTMEVDGEIIAYGVRNPWRFNFDAETGDLFIPDVGRHHWEELNYRRASKAGILNYGWPLAEGNACFLQCTTVDLVWPIYQYPTADLYQDSERENSCSIIGGEVYRGSDHPRWQGVYVFGDLCSGEIWAVRNVSAEPELRKLANTDLQITAIGSDPHGEILLTDGGGGAVYVLDFPGVWDAGWVDVDVAVSEMLLQAERTGYNRTNNELAAIFGSRRFQLAERVAEIYLWAESLFRSVKP